MFLCGPDDSDGVAMRTIYFLFLKSLFSFQSESSDTSSSENEAESEPEQVSGYHRLLATLKNVSKEDEEEEEEEEEDSVMDETETNLEDGDSDISEGEEMAAASADMQSSKSLCCGPSVFAGTADRLPQWYSALCYMSQVRAHGLKAEILSPAGLGDNFEVWQKTQDHLAINMEKWHFCLWFPGLQSWLKVPWLGGKGTFCSSLNLLKRLP